MARHPGQSRKWDREQKAKLRGVRTFVDALRETLRLDPLYGAKGAPRSSRQYGVARRFVQDSVQL